MIDREKVIKGLECLAQKQTPIANPCKDCGYINRPSFAICVKDIASDALKLLKEQEAVVRCKDCKHRPKEPNFETYESGFDLEFPEGSKCPCRCDDDEWYSWYPDDEWFCANGERKDIRVN